MGADWPLWGAALRSMAQPPVFPDRLVARKIRKGQDDYRMVFPAVPKLAPKSAARFSSAGCRAQACVTRCAGLAPMHSVVNSNPGYSVIISHPCVLCYAMRAAGCNRLFPGTEVRRQSRQHSRLSTWRAVDFKARGSRAPVIPLFVEASAFPHLTREDGLRQAGRADGVVPSRHRGTRRGHGRRLHSHRNLLAERHDATGRHGRLGEGKRRAAAGASGSPMSPPRHPTATVAGLHPWAGHPQWCEPAST